jgi:hypothetical protein
MKRALASAALALAASCVGGRTGIVDAGVEAEAGCSSATVRFRFVSRVGAAYCIGAPGTCAGEWLSVRTADNEELLLDHPCLADCVPCEPVACPALCAAPTRLAPTGETRTWDGTFYEQRTCRAGTACVAGRCAPVARYVARMCAYRDLSVDARAACARAPTPTCEDVAFDWPPRVGASDVTGEIDDS